MESAEEEAAATSSDTEEEDEEDEWSESSRYVCVSKDVAHRCVTKVLSYTLTLTQTRIKDPS